MARTNDLEKLAQKLASEGPYKHEATPRRVRGLLNGKYAFDTEQQQSQCAHHVWEHPYYPQLYIPTSSFCPDATLTKTSAVQGTNEAVHFGKLSVGSKTTEQVLIFNNGPLKDLVKVMFNEIDQWFEEDVPIFVHPKDPYKRVDILNSTRTVKVSLDGVVLAESSSPLFLFESLLRTRYYLPPTSVKWEYLKESDTETLCPYKGKANYYHVVIDGKEHKDLVWYYRYPTPESAPVAGHMCFYNEKVDISVNGVQERK